MAYYPTDTIQASEIMRGLRKLYDKKHICDYCKTVYKDKKPEICKNCGAPKHEYFAP